MLLLDLRIPVVPVRRQPLSALFSLGIEGAQVVIDRATKTPFQVVLSLDLRSNLASCRVDLLLDELQVLQDSGFCLGSTLGLALIPRLHLAGGHRLHDGLDRL